MAINYFVAQKYVDALGALSSSSNNKVMMIPLEAASVIGSISGITDIVQEVADRNPSTSGGQVNPKSTQNGGQDQ